MRRTILTASIASAIMLTGAPTVFSADAVTLTFNRTGSNAQSVTVSTEGIAGVSAELLSVSHSMKTSGSAITSSILCPDANGNTSPTITYVMAVNNLPADYKFNSIGIDIHALNGAGAYQESSDGVDRLWNVDIQTGASETALSAFASASDIDIAAGVNPDGARHKVWDFTASDEMAATSPHIIKLTVTKGSANGGCFFGISSVTLSGSGSTVDPDPDPEPSAGKTYTIKWKNNTSDYMTEAADGGIVISSYATHNKIFWELIPTGKTNCYYVRNTATGRYIGSCNMQPSSNSKVRMSDTPVEYYISKSSSTSGDNKGCWWMSSTDCSGYDSETSGARCLNKDGASTSIITWTTGVSNVGSYWTLTESEDLYETRPFNPAEAVGQADFFYHIIDGSNQSMALTHDMTWQKTAETENQKWYFVGSSNKDGGYIIVDASSNTPANSGAKYRVVENGNLTISFIGADNQRLSIGGVNEFLIRSMRSKLALDLQIYSMPCGSVADFYVTNATVISEGVTLHYPMPVRNGSSVSYPSASRPTDKYTIVSRDMIMVTEAGFTVNVKLNTTPSETVKAYLYFDWNRDGVFEETVELETGREMTSQTIIPPVGDENLGMSRMRLRLTDNGLTEAEDEVHGQVIDFKVKNLGPAVDTRYNPTLGVNDSHRGSAMYDENTKAAIATPRGTAAFLLWKEDMRILSTDATFEVEPMAVKRHLTAVFSPNLDPKTGISQEILATEAQGVAVTLTEDKTVNVITDTRVHHIFVFNTKGDIAAHVAGSSSLCISSIQSGIYIVKAITANGTATSKIAL